MGESQFIERTCMFCGDQSEDYKTELALDAHYWRSCPMLKRCLLCNQVIEISNIHTHLLTECEKSDSFMKCQHCHQAIESATYKKHVKSKSCQVSAQTKPNCCPLCQNKVQNGDAAWKSHLVGECKANAKRLQLQQGQGTPIDDNQEKPDAVLKSHKSKGPASHQMHAASHV